MVEFTKIKKEEINSFLNFIRENKIFINQIEKYLQDIFLIKEQNSINGFGIITLQDDKCWIKEIYILPHKRLTGYGDGLLRSMLNYAYTMGMEKAYYLKGNEEIYSFLLKEGFNDIQNVNNNDILGIKLKDFFTKSCANS